MARMPGAKWSGEHSPRNKMQRYDIVCIHTIVGYAPAHAAHFSTSGGGTIWQSRDTKYRSAANLNGNHRVIAIENEDHGPAFGSWNTRDGHAVPALTDAQVEANAQILAWAHKTHGVPLQLAPNSRPGSRGLAYHRQGIDGNWSGYAYGGRVSGGEVWTEHRGKVCPGDRRIAQLPAILARAKQIVNGGSGMSLNEQIKSYVDKDGKDSVEHAIATTRRDAYRTRSTLFYSGDTNEKSVYATKSGYRRLDSPAYPGTEENPRPTGSSDPDRRGASWRYALQRVWRYAYWGYRRIVRVESKVDSLQQEIAALRGMVETLLQREAGQQVTVEQIRESVRAELLAADERIVNVQISVNDANDPEDDPDVAHDDDA